MIIILMLGSAGIILDGFDGFQSVCTVTFDLSHLNSKKLAFFEYEQTPYVVENPTIYKSLKM